MTEIHGFAGPATLDQVLRNIRSERLIASGLVSLATCSNAQAKSLRVDPSAGLGMTEGQTLLSCQSEHAEISAHQIVEIGCVEAVPGLIADAPQSGLETPQWISPALDMRVVR